MNPPNENNLTEATLIEWFKAQGYDHVYGPDINPGQGGRAERARFHDVVLKDRLLGAIRRINPTLPAEPAEIVAKDIVDFYHNDLLLGNKEFYSYLTNGKKITYREDGVEKSEMVKLIDFKNKDANEFLVLNQFSVQGIDSTSRLDVVIFINGIPVGVFELKSAVRGQANIGEAYKQIERYKKNIPKLFLYNQIIGISDLVNARHGTISSSYERFGVWKGIEAPNDVSSNDTKQLETLIKGLFNKDRLLDVLQNFVVFEEGEANSTVSYIKKMCLYHQYYGVNDTVKSTTKSIDGEQDRKIGVFWHTQGSGKSLSMVFYVNKTKNIDELKSPAYLFLTDREDLDSQLSALFARVGYKEISHRATDILDLRDQLKQLDNGVSRLLFTTIQKFQDYKEEFSFFSERENIIVLADEAHRTQYSGLAGKVREALPKASFLAVTGTPIAKEDGANTMRVFGDIISEYKLSEAVKDGATVDIIYEARLVPLGIAKEEVNTIFDALLGDIVLEEKAKIQKEWAVLEKVIGTESRIQKIAHDIVLHFNQRPLWGKGMVVTMSRRIAVELYKEIIKIPDAPECAVVISNSDQFRNEIQKDQDTKSLEKRFKKDKDPLRLVIVCDMWLTGFDVPTVHTMYFDKPLKNHGLIQAIARVNRVYRDKSAGLIVDYIGIAPNLKKALTMYDGKIDNNYIQEIDDVVKKIVEVDEKIKVYFEGFDFSDYRQKKDVELNTVLQEATERVLSINGVLSDSRKMEYFDLVTKITKLHVSIMPDEKALPFSSRILFYQLVKEYVKKVGFIPRIIFPESAESAIHNLLNETVKAESVINLFGESDAGQQISIFDQKFEEKINNVKFKNLAVDATRKLLDSEIKSRTKHNEVRYETLLDLLKQTIEKYENNIISSAEVIRQLLEIAQDVKKLDEESKSLGLSPEEIVFYDTLQTDPDLKKSGIDIKEFVKDLTIRIRRDLSIDWLNNENIKSKVKQNVRLMLLQKGIIDHIQTERLVNAIYQETEKVFRVFEPVLN